MERFTHKVKEPKHPCYVDMFWEEYETKNKHEAIKKLGKLEDLEEQIGCPLEDLIAITDNTKSIIIDENKIGETFEKEKWKRVKSFIPNSFNRTYIFCDVWYEDNFKGIRDTLVIPIKQYKKTWWLKQDRSE